MGRWHLFLIVLGLFASGTIAQTCSSDMVHNIPDNMKLVDIPTSMGLPMMVSTHQLMSDYFKLYVGSPSICQKIILCTIDSQASTQDIKKCKDDSNVLTIVPPDNQLTVGKNAHPFAGVTLLFTKTDKTKNEYEFEVPNNVYQWTRNQHKMSKIKISLGPTVALFTSSRTCPSSIYVAMHGASYKYAGQTPKSMAPPLLHLDNIHGAKRVRLMPNVELTKPDFTSDKCCSPYYVYENGMAPSRWAAVDYTSFAKYKFSAKDPSKTIKSVLLELREERPCEWIRICFESAASQTACQTPGKIIDIMLKNRFIVPTDSDQAYDLQTERDEANKFEIRLEQQNHLVLSYGATLGKPQRPINHGMKLEGWNFDKDSIVLAMPPYCSARLTKHLGNPTVKPSYISKNQGVDITGCNCHSKKP